MVIFFGSQKGGPGKSTFALNMSVMRALEGRRVLLIDTDSQGSGQSWTHARKKKGIEPFVTCVIGKGDGIADTIRELQQGFDDIVVDTKGDNSVEFRVGITVADRVVSPMEPSQFDVETLTFLERLVGDVRHVNPRLDALLVANKAGSHPRDADLQDLRKYAAKTCKQYRMMDGAVVSRKIYKICAKRARAVVELTGTGGYDKALLEMQALAGEVWK